MERLTYRAELGVSIDKNEDCPTCSICWNCDIPPRKCKYISDVLEKLADYEDLEEQGRLVKLPCKVGDTVYAIIYDYEVEQYAIKKSEIIEVRENINGIFFVSLINKPAFKFNDFGKTIFLTKSEAEAKLKELRGKNE